MKLKLNSDASTRADGGLRWITGSAAVPEQSAATPDTGGWTGEHSSVGVLLRRRDEAQAPRYHLAAYRERRSNGEATFATTPSERFLPSLRMVAPSLAIAAIGTLLDELPDYVGDHADREDVPGALIGLQDELEDVFDRYLAALVAVTYGDDESGGQP